jgi:cytochrome c peroxidase
MKDNRQTQTRNSNTSPKAESGRKRHRLFNAWSVLIFLLCVQIVTEAARCHASETGAQASYGDEPGQRAVVVHGRKLFKDETFGGNGRTCTSCHSLQTGTLAPQDAQVRFIQATLSKQGLTSDPLFRSTDSDDGVSEQYDRLLTNATIRAKIDLHPNVSVAADPSARSIIVNRGIPSVINSGLLKAIMQDGRAPDLEHQALAAILGHAQATQLPTTNQLHEIAQYERSLFSRTELANYFKGGPAPEVPQGATPQQKNGRRLCEQFCFFCHGGPMLDQAIDGERFFSIGVSELNRIRNPKQTFIFKNADGTSQAVTTPDPGRAAVDGDPAHINAFRTPTLWNIRNTAPYFHDNSAKTLEDVVDHYRDVLGFPISDQDKRDLVAFMELL